MALTLTSKSLSKRASDMGAEISGFADKHHLRTIGKNLALYGGATALAIGLADRTSSKSKTIAVAGALGLATGLFLKFSKGPNPRSPAMPPLPKK